jgi:uncharacterized membrane protein
MDPGMRAVLAVLGVLIGAALSNSAVIVGALFGGFVGYAIAELRLLRAMIGKLEQEVARLRRRNLDDVAAPQVAAARGQPGDPPAPTSALAPLPTSPLAPVVPHSAPTATASPMAVPPHEDMPLVAAIKRFFSGGNTLVQAGVIVLFFGVAFLLRYLAEHSHVSIEVRLSAVAVAGVVLLLLGWRLRERRAGYALALQGGGVGILYLTVFAALRLYGLLPPTLALVILASIAVLSAALAVLQDSAAFALIGISGGFLAPLLASSGEGSHVVLFSYYLILNLSVALMAWFKAWRPLNLAGFIATFAIATVWGVLKYQRQDFVSTEPFLIAFFLLYVGIAVLFTLRQPLNLRGYVDGPLVFGTPIVAFGLQSAMLLHDSMALAYSALVMSAFYLLLTFAVKRRAEASQALLGESFLGLGVAFLTLAIPLALGSRLNSAAWALEGASLVWVGCRQGRRAARAVGTLLILAAACLLMGEARFEGRWLLPLSVYPSVILVSVACLVSVWNLDRIAPTLRSYEKPYATILFVVGLLAWVGGGLGELPHLVTVNYLTAASLGFLSVSAWLLSELKQRAALRRAARAALLLLPAMYVFFAAALASGSHPFGWAGWLAWPISFVLFYLIAHRHEGAPRRALSNAVQTFSAWLLCLILGWEAGWLVHLAVGSGSPEWMQAARVIPPALALLLLPRLVKGVPWPCGVHRETYLSSVGLGLTSGMAAWSLVSNFLLQGNAAPLPYLPLLNPLDVAQALVLLLLLRHWLLLRAESFMGAALDARVPPAVLAALLFVWLNGVLLRSLHHWLGVPLRFDALAASNVVETCVSIFWSVLALAAMLLASRKGNRPSWLVGAGLLIIVIIKLFFVDLSSVGSIERIVSFVGVGVAMLVVGYFSPLPPRLKES